VAADSEEQRNGWVERLQRTNTHIYHAYVDTNLHIHAKLTCTYTVAADSEEQRNGWVERLRMTIMLRLANVRAQEYFFSTVYIQSEK
jgi:hypothetical protein